MYSLAELADLLNGALHGNAEQSIQGIASLSAASKTTLAYFDNPALLYLLENTQAGAVLLTADYLTHCPVNSIVVANPADSIVKLAQIFLPGQKEPEGIHPSASISASACLGEEISIGAHSIIADGVVLEDGVKIGANSVVEAGVKIGSRTIINHGVYIHSGATLGRDLVIESGVVLGASPFNCIKKHGSWQRGAAFGGVVISDNVHLGANTVVDRGTFGDTFIGEGVHIDNLVQIAHDVTIGAHSAIAGCVAIGAFARIGSHCIIDGASCLAANVHLDDDIVITGMSTVSKSLTKPGLYSSGTMVSEHRRWRRNVARFRRLDDYVMRLTRLEKEWQRNQE